MRDVVAELGQRRVARTIGLPGREAGRCRGQRIPEAEADRPRRHVAPHGVVGIGQPEGRGVRVGREDADVRGRRARRQAEVPLDRVAGLGAVLEEVAVPEVIATC